MTVLTIDANAALLLLKFDEANGSSSTVDSSFFNNRVTLNGGALTSTEQAKWGSSLKLTGNSYATVDSTDAINLDGSTRFTIEFWLFLNSVNSGYTTFLTRRIGTSWQYYFGFSEQGLPKLYFSSSIGGSHISSGSELVPLGRWVHIAASVDPFVSDGLAKLFIDGVLVGSGPWSRAPLNNTDLYIGALSGGSEGVDGYIDDVRIVKNNIYTNNFTPPSAPLTNLAGDGTSPITTTASPPIGFTTTTTTIRASTTTTTTTTTTIPPSLCNCGAMFLPIGSKHNKDGLSLEIIHENGVFISDLVHNKDVFVASEQKFITSTPTLSFTQDINPIAFIIRFNSKYNVNIEKTVIFSIKLLGDDSLVAYKIASNRDKVLDSGLTKFVIDSCSDDTINLNNQKVVLEVYSVCQRSEQQCCDKPPSSIFISPSFINVPCVEPAVTTTTSPGLTTTSTTTTKQPNVIPAPDINLECIPLGCSISWIQSPTVFYIDGLYRSIPIESIVLESSVDQINWIRDIYTLSSPPSVVTSPSQFYVNFFQMVDAQRHFFRVAIKSSMSSDGASGSIGPFSSVKSIVCSIPTTSTTSTSTTPTPSSSTTSTSTTPTPSSSTTSTTSAPAILFDKFYCIEDLIISSTTTTITTTPIFDSTTTTTTEEPTTTTEEPTTTTEEPTTTTEEPTTTTEEPTTTTEEPTTTTEEPTTTTEEPTTTTEEPTTTTEEPTTTTEEPTTTTEEPTTSTTTIHPFAPLPPDVLVAGTTVYRNKMTFDSLLPAGRYCDDLSSLPRSYTGDNTVSIPTQTLSGGSPNISYSISSTGDLYIDEYPPLFPNTVGTYNFRNTLVITFNTNNVRRVGFHAYVSSFVGFGIDGVIVIRLSNGSIIYHTSSTPLTLENSFIGFATSSPISSIILERYTRLHQEEYLNMGYPCVSIG